MALPLLFPRLTISAVEKSIEIFFGSISSPLIFSLLYFNGVKLKCL